MGFMQWLRGKDDTAVAMVSAGLAEIDGLFRPTKHKQTEHVEESRRRRVDVANGADVDLEKGIAVIRTPARAEPSGAERSEAESPDAGPANGAANGAAPATDAAPATEAAPPAEAERAAGAA